MNRIRTILLVAGVLLVAAAIAGVAQPHLGRSATPSSGSTITVTASGTVDATPDRASFDFGVTTNGATAAEALSRNASEAGTIVDGLQKAGVAPSAIQTTQVSLWPQTSSDGMRITGYQAANSVQVSAALAESGALVDAAVRAGANNVDGPNLDTSDTSSLYDRALTQALGNAKGKAQTIASAAGLSLGKVLKVDEGAAQTPLVYGEALGTKAAAPPIEAGTQKIEASVTVTYAAG